MRVFDCNECGATLKAANDAELATQLTRHMNEEHSEVEWDDDQASDLISRQAYSATDS